MYGNLTEVFAATLSDRADMKYEKCDKDVPPSETGFACHCHFALSKCGFVCANAIDCAA